MMNLSVDEFDMTMSRRRVLAALDGDPEPGDVRLDNLIRWHVLYGDQATITFLTNMLDQRQRDGARD